MSEEPKNSKKRFGWVRDLLLFVVLVGGVMAYQTWDHVSRGSAMPSFDLALLDTDATVESSKLTGKPTVIYFWAPWCTVCEASSHNMNALHRAASGEANVLSMAVEYRDLDTVRQFVRANEVEYPVILGDASTREAFAVTSFPTIYVFDKDGHVSSSVVGYTTELGLRARLFWASL